MFERIPQDKQAASAAVQAQVSAYQARGGKIKECPPCRTAWQYYAVCVGNSRDEEDALILKRTKGDPLALVKQHRAKMEAKIEGLKGAKKEGNRLGAIAYAQAIAAGASAQEGRRLRNTAVRHHMKAVKTEKVKGDTKETTNNSLFNGGRASTKAILAMKAESASFNTLLTPIILDGKDDIDDNVERDERE